MGPGAGDGEFLLEDDTDAAWWRKLVPLVVGIGVLLSKLSLLLGPPSIALGETTERGVA